MKGKNTTFITRQKRWPKNRSKVWADTREIIIAGTHPLLRDKGGVITMRDEVEVEQADRITEAVMRLMARDTIVTMSSRPKRETWDKPEHTIETDTQIQGRTIQLIAGITKHNHPPGTTMVQIRTTYRNVAIVKIRTAGPRAPRKKIMTKKESSPDTRTCRQIIHANNRWALAAPAAEMVAVGTAALAAPVTGFRHHLQYRL